MTGLMYTHPVRKVFYMKTTFDIDGGLMRRLREEAARRGMTPSALLEAGRMSVLAEPVACDKQSEDLPPLPTWQSGGVPNRYRQPR